MYRTSLESQFNVAFTTPGFCFGLFAILCLVPWCQYLRVFYFLIIFFLLKQVPLPTVHFIKNFTFWREFEWTRALPGKLILGFHKRWKLHFWVFYFKIYWGACPKPFPNHNRSTRLANLNFHCPVLRKNIEGGQTFSVRNTRNWNELSLDVKKVKNVKSFKKKLYYEFDR